MELGTFKLELDKRWELNEFSVFTKEYAQVYNFFYILELMDENERFALDVSTYPWEGGYSVYNFFRKLSSYTPKSIDHILQDLSMHHLDLSSLRV